MNILKAIIVDDEERGINALSKLIENYCPDIQVIATARNVEEASLAIKELKPEIVFLDIEMPEKSGFDLLNSFDHIDFEIVFITAFQEYAIKAIKFAALDYLLKPVNISELVEVIEKFKIKKAGISSREKYAILKQSLSTANAFKKIILTDAENFHFVNIEDILYCKAEDNYTRFVAINDKKYIVSRLLKEYDDLLHMNNFFRIHKSYLVNMNHVEKVIKKDGASVLMSNKEELPVSSRKKDEFFTFLKNFR